MDATPMDLSDPAPAISNILDIPPELLTLTILKFLPIPSVVSLAKTCRALRAVAAADEVWAKLLARVFPDVTTLPPKPTKISTFAALAATKMSPAPAAEVAPVQDADAPGSQT